MTRKILIKKRFLDYDVKYNNILVNLLINRILKCGKKRLAKKIVYKSFDLVESILKLNPILVLEKSIRKISPQFQIKMNENKQRTHHTPIPLSLFKSINLGIRWLVEFARKRVGREMSLKLATEIIESYNNLGNAIKKKEEISKYIKNNKNIV